MPELVIDRVKLRYLREGLGWTQQDLADRSGIGRSTISKIETGGRTNLRTTTLRSLAATLGVATDDLLISATGKATKEQPESYRPALAAIQKSLEDLSSDEIENVREYIDFMRSRRKRPRADLQ